jgi:hypothetical protein
MHTVSLSKHLIRSLSFSARSLTPLKFQIFVSGPQRFLKMEYQAKVIIPIPYLSLHRPSLCKDRN